MNMIPIKKLLKKKLNTKHQRNLDHQKTIACHSKVALFMIINYL